MSPLPNHLFFVFLKGIIDLRQLGLRKHLLCGGEQESVLLVDVVLEQATGIFYGYILFRKSPKKLSPPATWRGREGGSSG